MFFREKTFIHKNCDARLFFEPVFASVQGFLRCFGLIKTGMLADSGIRLRTKWALRARFAGLLVVANLSYLLTAYSANWPHSWRRWRRLRARLRGGPCWILRRYSLHRCFRLLWSSLYI